MGDDEVKRHRREVIRQFFRFADSGDYKVLDFYTEDVELIFPKFGRARGKAAVRELTTRMSRHLKKLEHDIEGLVFIEADDATAVEGKEWGEMADGTPFPDGIVLEGLFCNVFRFRGDLICSVHIYVDPDFTSSDAKVIAALK